jgi:hypothetical protein
MITFFTVPKPFIGLTAGQQRNAIGSWRAVIPGAQVILCGDESGLDAVALELGVERIPEVARSPSGAPLLNHVFERACASARHDMLCFVNTDIILRGDLTVLQQLRPPFLVIGESLDIEVPTPVRFGDPAWRGAFATGGRSRGPFAIDYFFFSRGLFESLPPFAIGRARFDNWLVWRALHQGAMVIDGTALCQAIHQRHEYGHLAGGRREAYRGADARRNQALAGLRCYVHLYSILDAQWRLTSRGAQRISRRFVFLQQLWRRLLVRVLEHTTRRRGADGVRG